MQKHNETPENKCDKKNHETSIPIPFKMQTHKKTTQTRLTLGCKKRKTAALKLYRILQAQRWHLKILVFEAEKGSVLHLLIKIHTRRTNSELKSQWHGRNRRKLKDRPRVRTTVEWYPFTKHYLCHSYVATQHKQCTKHFAHHDKSNNRRPRSENAPILRDLLKKCKFKI